MHLNKNRLSDSVSTADLMSQFDYNKNPYESEYIALLTEVQRTKDCIHSLKTSEIPDAKRKFTQRYDHTGSLKSIFLEQDKQIEYMEDEHEKL